MKSIYLSVATIALSIASLTSLEVNAAPSIYYQSVELKLTDPEVNLIRKLGKPTHQNLYVTVWDKPDATINTFWTNGRLDSIRIEAKANKPTNSYIVIKGKSYKLGEVTFSQANNVIGKGCFNDVGYQNKNELTFWSKDQGYNASVGASYSSKQKSNVAFSKKISMIEITTPEMDPEVNGSCR